MSLKSEPPTCPLCSTVLHELPRFEGDRALVTCRNCGSYVISRTAEVILASSRFDHVAKAKLSFAVRKMPAETVLSSTLVETIVENTTLPLALERLDNVIMHMATAVEPGAPTDFDSDNVRAIAGAVSSDAGAWVLTELLEAGYVRGHLSATLGGPQHLLQAVLTSRGWDRYDELTRSGSHSKHAFMAMKYGDDELDRVFAECLKPAVAQTGFVLRRLDESPAAGLIDNRMRVEIRTSRFLVCDLSHGNRGAYWEAGFAEGVGRPVIYLCRDDVFAVGHADRPHFDTNHHAIIVWSPTQLDRLGQQLKDMVRATLPAEAKMEDA